MDITNKKNDFYEGPYFYNGELKMEKDDKFLTIEGIINELGELSVRTLNFLLKNCSNYYNGDCIHEIPLIKRFVLFKRLLRLDKIESFISLYHFPYQNKKVCVYFLPLSIRLKTHIPYTKKDRDFFNKTKQDYTKKKRFTDFEFPQIFFGYYIHDPNKDIPERTRFVEFNYTDMAHELCTMLPSWNDPDKDLGINFFSILRSFDLSELEKMRSEIKNDQLEKLDKRLRDLEKLYIPKDKLD